MSGKRQKSEVEKMEERFGILAVVRKDDTIPDLADAMNDVLRAKPLPTIVHLNNCSKSGRGSIVLARKPMKESQAMAYWKLFQKDEWADDEP